MEYRMQFGFIFLLLVTIQSVAYCRPSHKDLTGYLFGQQKLIIGDIKNGDLNVSHRRKMKLFSPKSRGYLQVFKKHVNANGDSKSEHINLIVESVGFDLIRIKGKFSGCYVCFNPRTSKLIAKRNGNDVDCIFTETIGEKTKRTIFTSWLHKSWHIGIKNNGKPRLGQRPNKTTFHNNTYEFTPMRGRRYKHKELKYKKEV